MEMHLGLRKSFLLILMIIIIGIQIFCIDESFSMAFTKKPTVIVVDDETGKPIEGAVAVAIWRKLSLEKGAWFEGGIEVVARIEEAVSDKEGKIYIDGFFNWRPFSQNPHLTIYKPGYVCWDQEHIYINEFKSEKRKDFDKGHRIARLKKYPEGFSFVGHGRFVDSVTSYDYTKALEGIFQKAFDYETGYRVKESTERNKKRKELKKQKEGDNNE